MAFQIKDFVSVTSSILNHMRGTTTKITDLQQGSVARTLVEGPAVEIEELYLQMFLGLREAIPVATFRSFGFDKLPAATAIGYVSVATLTPLESDMLIPAGTAFTATDGRSYLSVEEVTWPAGSGIILIPVAHSAPGLIGNIAAGAITGSPSFGVGFTVSNQAITNGRDVESDAEREVRFAEFVASLSRGTDEACAYAAKQSRVLDVAGNLAEYVTRLGMEAGGGRVRLFVYSNIGEPSAALLQDGQRRIDGWTDPDTGVVTPGYVAAGIRADVLPMIERAIPLAISVGMLPGYTLTSSVEQQLLDLFATAIRSVQPGETLYLGDLTEAMLAAVGVQQIVPASSENITCGVYEALIPGTLTVTAL